MRAFTALAAGLLLASTAAQAAPDPEAKLAEALKGRVAGEPVNCISLSRVRSTQVIEDTAILYDVGGTIYVNRPENGREQLNRWDTLVTKTHGGQLCAIDVVEMRDLQAGMMTGLVFLGEFVPYKRVKTAAN